MFAPYHKKIHIINQGKQFPDFFYERKKKMAIFTNQATLSYNGNTVNSNTVVGNIVEVITVTKTAVTSEYTTNDNITYIISLTNSGNTPLTGVTVTDDLGSYEINGTSVLPLNYVENSVVYYQNGVLQPDPAVTATNPLTFTGITVPANGNAILVYETTTTAFAPLSPDSTITNRATATAGGITAPVSDEATITVTDESVLSITKALNPVNVTENSELTYTFTIQNTGNTAAAATDDIVITDVFNPILSNITVTQNCTVLPETSYTYNETTGVFSTVAGEITVPAATYTQNPVTGEYVITPGVTVVTVTGTV